LETTSHYEAHAILQLKILLTLPLEWDLQASATKSSFSFPFFTTESQNANISPHILVGFEDSVFLAPEATSSFLLMIWSQVCCEREEQWFEEEGRKCLSLKRMGKDFPKSKRWEDLKNLTKSQERALFHCSGASGS
jgi:hypothetical protein